MAIVKIVENSGNKMASSNNGTISVNETAGTAVVRDDDQRVVAIYKLNIS